MDPYPTSRPFPRAGTFAQDRNINADSQFAPSERVLYRICQYVNENPILLKDAGDRSDAPRALIVLKNNSSTLLYNEGGHLSSLKDLELKVFDEVLVSQYKPWRNARGLQMRGRTLRMSPVHP